MARSFHGALALFSVFFFVVACGDNKQNPYNQTGYNGQQLPPGQQGPAQPGQPGQPVPPSGQGPEGPAVGPTTNPNDLGFTDYRKDPTYQPNAPVYPPMQPVPTGQTYPPIAPVTPIAPVGAPPLHNYNEGDIYIRAEFAQPTIEVLTPYFLGLRCPNTGAPLMNTQTAIAEARWIVRNGIDFRLYHRTLSYLRRMRIIENGQIHWAFWGMDPVILTRQILSSRATFDVCEFDRLYRRALRAGRCGREAVRFALCQMHRDFDYEIRIYVRH